MIVMKFGGTGCAGCEHGEELALRIAAAPALEPVLFLHRREERRNRVHVGAVHDAGTAPAVQEILRTVSHILSEQ